MATYTGSDKRLKYLFEHIGDGGRQKIFYGTCNTSASARQKEVTVSVDQDFYLYTGVVVFVTFDNTNTYEADASNPVTLNVNGSGSSNIKYGSSSTPTGTNTTAFGRANYTNCYVFDGTYWVWQGSSADNNTTYQNRAEAQGGTQTSLVTTGEKYTWNRKVSDNPTFTEASARANIASGESFSTILGKIKKFFTDLKTVAFTGSYSDLTDQPTIPTVPDIADNLTTNDATKVLSAKQGKILNDKKIDKVASEIKTNTSGQFETVTGGKLLSCILSFSPKQSGSGTPSTSNVRPITGHPSGEVLRRGKNFLPLDIDAIKSANTGGSWSGNVYTQNNLTFTILTDNDGNVTSIKASGTPNAETTLYISFKGIPTGDYYFNGCANGGSDSNFDMFCWDGTTSSRLKKWNGTTNSSSIYTDSTSSEIKVSDSTHNMTLRIRVRSGYQANNLMFYPMIRLGNVTDASFEPYQAQDITIQFGDTYYGGTFDFVSGVLTVTHKYKKLTSSNQLGGFATSAQYGAYAYVNDTTDCLATDSAKVYGLCSMCEYVSFDNRLTTANVNRVWSDKNNTKLFVRASVSSNVSTLADLFAIFENAQICYELATPITIQLTPSQINTLVGQNNLSAPLDGQSIQSAQYREVLSWDDVEEKYQYEEAQLTDSIFLARVRRFGRVVNIEIPKPLYPMGTAEDSWISLGILPERFYHKYPNPIVEVSIYATIATFVDDGNDIVPLLVRINQFSGDVLGYFKAENYVQPFGTITYILDHD